MQAMPCDYREERTLLEHVVRHEAKAIAVGALAGASPLSASRPLLPARQRPLALISVVPPRTRRRAFLDAEASRERGTLSAIHTNTGPAFVVAALVVSLTIRQFEAELAWLDEVDAALSREQPQALARRAPPTTRLREGVDE
jgi:hypothetical protein